MEAFSSDDEEFNLKTEVPKSQIKTSEFEKTLEYQTGTFDEVNHIF